MRVLVVNYEYPPIGGGGGFVTRDIFECMVENGHSVSVITSHCDGLERWEIINGVEVIRVPVFFRNQLEVANLPSMLTYPPSCLAQGLALIGRREYDLINTHFAIPSGPAGQLLSMLLRVPNVLSLHGGDIFDPSKALSPHRSKFFSVVVRDIINRADRVVAQSSNTKMNAQVYHKVHRNIDIIPLGIKKPAFECKSRNDFGLDANEFIFCSIGRLIKRKNLNDSIEILSKLKDRYSFKFLIIGEGPERRYLEKQTNDLGLYDRVRFYGNVSDELKFQLLQISDCYCSTALHEGFGLVFLEAMECGLPVVCYNEGGQNDFLVDGKTGYLVAVGDKSSFTERLNDLMRHPQQRTAISSYNKALVKNYYISNCTQKYITLFDHVISKSNKSKKLK